MDILALITAIIIVFGVIIKYSNQILSLWEKVIKIFESSERKKFKKSFIEGNPDFKFSLGYISNTPAGICRITLSLTNLAKEIRYINMVSYNFAIPNDIRHLPPFDIVRQGQFPKRLEYGEPFHIQEEIQNILFNTLYDYWQRDVKVYATCKSTLEDHLRSNYLEYDDLVKRLVPLKKEYEDLAHSLAKKFKVLNRDIEVILWQLQHFNRITSQMAKQLEINNIPIINYLIKHHGIIWKDNSSWPEIYRDLEKKKIPPKIITDYLKSLL